MGPRDSGMAAIAAVARHYGIELTERDIRSLADGAPARLDLFHLLFCARQAGLGATPLGGEYELLPEVPRPNIVVFRDGAAGPEFRVLVDIDADSARTLDPTSGAEESLAREEFLKRWTGDIVDVQPDETLAGEARRRLAELKNPLRWLGLPPAPRAGLLFLPGAVLALAVAASSDRNTLGAIAFALCFASSLWAALLTSDCARCSKVAALVGGLPVAWAGVALYGALVGAAAFGGPSVATAVALLIAAAVGTHAALVAQLVRAKLLCPACVVTAVLALVAGVVWTIPERPWAWLAVVPAGLLAVGIISVAARIHGEVVHAASVRMAVRTAEEPRSIPEGTAHLVVYKRPGCAICAYFDAAIRPAIEEEFGEALTIEARDPGRDPTGTPLAVICGSSMQAAILGLSEADGHERLRGAIEAAMESRAQPLGLWIQGF